MGKKNFQAGQLIPTSSTPPGNAGFYRIDKNTIGVVGNLVQKNANTNVESNVATGDNLAAELAAIGVVSFNQNAAISGPRKFAGRPRLLSFGCSISQQQNAYLVNGTTTSQSVDQAVQGLKVFNVTNGALLTVNDKIAFPLHTGRIFTTIVTAISTNAITVADEIPGLIRATSTVTKYTNNFPALRQPLSAIGAAVAMLGGPVEMLPPYGYGGAVYQAMIGDLDRELRWYHPDFVALHLFDNDMTSAAGVGATSLEQFKMWARQSANKCLAYGATPIQCSQMPYYNGSVGVPASRAADYDALADYIGTAVLDGKSQFEIDVPGAIGCDLSRGWLDPAYLNDASWPRRPLSGWTDGVHPTSAKRFDVGQFALAALRKCLPPAVPVSESAVTNLEFSTLVGTGGVNDGTYPYEAGSIAPTGSTIAAYGAAEATSSRNADGSLRISCVWPGTPSQGADGIIIKFFFTPTKSTYGSIDRFSMFVRFRIQSKTGLAQVYPSVALSAASDAYSADFANDIASSMPADGSIICLMTPSFSFFQGNTSAQLQLEIRPTTGAVGANAVIDVIEYGLVNVTSEIPHSYT